MKKILLFSLLAISIVLKSYAQIVNIPDSNFKAILISNPDINTNGDTEIQVSEAKTYTGSIEVRTSFENKVKDLTGIEAFSALTKLDCSINELKSIDLSKNEALEILDCSFNHLESLDISKNQALKELTCHYNLISSLDLSNNLALEYLECAINGLSDLDISKNPKLKVLSCFGNGFSSINLANGNNKNFTSVVATRCFKLTCIQVDNGFIPSPEIWKIDTLARYSYDCGVYNTPVWYADKDGDGYGNTTDSLISAAQPVDFVSDNTDCDDTNKDIHPGATDIVGNGIDENCDGVDEKVWYADKDGDGYGNQADSLVAGIQPDNYVLDNTDCDDANKDIYPGAPKIVGNGIDENCDGVDEKVWYADKDGDGYGNQADSLVAGIQPDNYVLDNTDCDDANKDIYPGAPKIVGNGIDENCDGVDEKVWYADKDGDGYGNQADSLVAGIQPDNYVLDNTDCDDANKDIYPGAPKIVGNGIDENCDGIIEQKRVALKIEVKTFNKQPITKTKIILYKSQSDENLLLKEKQLNETGDLVFDSLETGTYFIKVIPDFGNYPNLLTTYSGDSPLQSEAEIITLDSSLTYSINLIEIADDLNGSGKIEGLALLKEGNSGGRIITNTEEKGTPIPNVPVFLFPINSKKVIGFSTTDDDGKFLFKGLLDNKYYLKADYKGIPVDLLNSEVEISKENSLQVSLLVGEKIRIEINAVTGLKNIDFAGIVEVYPNPIKNKVNINFEEGTQILSFQVFDLLGRLLKHGEFSNFSETNVQLDFSDLSCGIYQFFLNTNQGSVLWKVLKE